MFEIGNSLREARLRRHLDLVEAEDDTKIRSKYLAAMETEDFDVLPGPVYTRGFLRTYARYLGLEAQLYIDEYNSRFGQFEEAEEAAAVIRATPLLRPRRRGGILSLRTLAILSLLALAGFAWFGLRSGEPGVEENARVADGIKAAETDSGTFADRHNEESTAAAAERARVAKSAAAAAAPAPAGGAVPPFTVTARRASSWLEVRKATSTGKVLFQGTLKSGSSKAFPGRRLYVTIGLPSATVLKRGRRAVTPTGSGAESYVVTRSSITRAR